MPTDELCVNIAEETAHSQVSKDTVYRCVDTQGLPGHGVGGFGFRPY